MCTARRAAHILGYVGAPGRHETRKKARKYTFLIQGDGDGKSNIEKSMDEYLRGKPGRALFGGP